MYEPTAAQRAAIEESLIETSPFERYDASKENRATGAAFYQFSADEETRQRQMDELKRTRDETVQARRDLAVDLVPQNAGDSAAGTARVASRAVEKRKQELEERRKMLEAKRRKMLGGNVDAGADDFLASLEKELFPTSSV